MYHSIIIFKRFFRLLPYIVFSIFLTTIIAAETSSAKEPYQKNLSIGVLGPMTGESSKHGAPMLEGIKLALEKFNKSGGVNGKNIELVVRDTGGGQFKTNNAINEFLEKKVVAILASPSGWSTFGPVSTANRSWTILMSVGSQRHIGRSGNFIFRCSLSDEIATDDLIKYSSIKLGYKRYAIITSMLDDEASLSIAGLYRKALQKHGGQVVAEAFTDFGMSLKETIAALKKDAKGTIDAVIFAGGAKSGAKVVKELRKQGIKAPLIGGEGLKSSSYLKSAGSASVGTLLYTSFTSLSKSKESKSFVKAFRAKTGHYPTPLAALGYDSFMMIANALKKSGTTEPKKVANELWDTKDYEGVSCAISFDDSGESINKAFVLRVVKGKKGPFFSLIQ